MTNVETVGGEPICVWMRVAARWGRTLLGRHRFLQDEYESATSVALVRAVSLHREDRATFASYWYSCCLRVAVDVIRQWHRHKRAEAMMADALESNADRPRESFDDLLEGLPPRNAEYLRLLYVLGYSRREAAQAIGIHPQTARRIEQDSYSIIRGFRHEETRATEGAGGRRRLPRLRNSRRAQDSSVNTASEPPKRSPCGTYPGATFGENVDTGSIWSPSVGGIRHA